MKTFAWFVIGAAVLFGLALFAADAYLERKFQTEPQKVQMH